MRALLPLLAVVVACGALPSAPIDAGTASDGGMSIDAGAHDAGVVTGPSKTGAIELRQSPIVIGSTISYVGSLSASFTTSTGVGSVCTTTITGPCSATRCESPTDAGASSTRFDSAGNMSISGTRVDGGITAFDSGSFVGYSETFMGQLWGGGETISVSVSGAVVPTFSNKTVVAPSMITVTAPSCPQAFCGSISRASPLTITWSGGSIGTVAVALSTSDHPAPPNATVFVQCTFTASAGTGTIPAAALGALQAREGVVTVWNQGSTTFVAGEHQVTFNAVTTGLTAGAQFQ